MEQLVTLMHILIGLLVILGLFGGYYLRHLRSQLGILIEINGAVAVQSKQQLMNQVLLHQTLSELLDNDLTVEVSDSELESESESSYH